MVQQLGLMVQQLELKMVIWNISEVEIKTIKCENVK